MTLKDKLHQLFLEYAVEEGCNKRAAVRDMVTELHHISDQYGVNFQDVIEGSEAVHAEEVALASLNASNIEHVNHQ